jgi:processive 1,2-diacylglycerol beta-glucosyltransferase
MKKIMMLYCTAGMGHKKAAMALSQIFSARGKGAFDLKNIDTLEYGDKAYKFMYQDFYVFMMTKGKWLWGMLYYLSDMPFLKKFLAGMRRDMDVRELSKLMDLIIKEKPDAIVATHFVLPNIAPALREMKEINPKMYVVVTDYGPHAFWLSDGIDKFFVGAGSMIDAFVKRGIPKEKVVLSGIPGVEEFVKSYDVPALKRAYGMDPSRKTVFLLSGGFGVGPTEQILAALGKVSSKIQAIVVCGRNKEAYERINSFKNDLKYPVVLLGFTDKVHELMAVSDVIVTKAGGISTTEALNSRLPMILIDSIPGQETWNEGFVTGAGAGVKAGRIGDIPAMIDDLFSSPEKLEAIKRGIDTIRRPNAAKDIVENILKDLGIE